MQIITRVGVWPCAAVWWQPPACAVVSSGRNERTKPRRYVSLGSATPPCGAPAWHNIVSALRAFFGKKVKVKDNCNNSGMLELLLDAIGILSEKYVKNEANARCLSFL